MYNIITLIVIGNLNNLISTVKRVRVATLKDRRETQRSNISSPKPLFHEKTLSKNMFYCILHICVLGELDIYVNHGHDTAKAEKK